MPAFCAAERQVPSRAPLQVGTSRSRSNAAWHAFVSWTRPSTAPSSASQLREHGVRDEPTLGEREAGAGIGRVASASAA